MLEDQCVGAAMSVSAREDASPLARQRKRKISSAGDSNSLPNIASPHQQSDSATTSKTISRSLLSKVPHSRLNAYAKSVKDAAAPKFRASCWQKCFPAGPFVGLVGVVTGILGVLFLLGPLKLLTSVECCQRGRGSGVFDLLARVGKSWWFGTIACLLWDVIAVDLRCYNVDNRNEELSPLQLLSGALQVFAQIPKKNNILLISNHPCELDWCFLWLVLAAHGRLQSLKIILKDISSLPIFGWACYYFRFIFVCRNNRAEDMRRIARSLKGEDRVGLPTTLLIFPEGTDLSTGLERSQQFAKENNKPVWGNVLTPRVTGFKECVSIMQKMPRDFTLVDVTLAYEGYETELSPAATFWRNDCPTVLHVDCQRLFVGEDEAGLMEVPGGVNGGLLREVEEDHFCPEIRLDVAAELVGEGEMEVERVAEEVEEDENQNAGATEETSLLSSQEVAAYNEDSSAKRDASCSDPLVEAAQGGNDPAPLEREQVGGSSSSTSSKQKDGHGAAASKLKHSHYGARNVYLNRCVSRNWLAKIQADNLVALTAALPANTVVNHVARDEAAHDDPRASVTLAPKVEPLYAGGAPDSINSKRSTSTAAPADGSSLGCSEAEESDVGAGAGVGEMEAIANQGGNGNGNDQPAADYANGHNHEAQAGEDTETSGAEEQEKKVLLHRDEHQDAAGEDSYSSSSDFLAGQSDSSFRLVPVKNVPPEQRRALRLRSPRKVVKQDKLQDLLIDTPPPSASSSTRRRQDRGQDHRGKGNGKGVGAGEQQEVADDEHRSPLGLTTHQGPEERPRDPRALDPRTANQITATPPNAKKVSIPDISGDDFVEAALMASFERKEQMLDGEKNSGFDSSQEQPSLNLFKHGALCSFLRRLQYYGVWTLAVTVIAELWLGFAYAMTILLFFSLWTLMHGYDIWFDRGLFLMLVGSEVFLFLGYYQYHWNFDHRAGLFLKAVAWLASHF